MIDLSIIIVSFNAREDLERCLQSLGDAPPAAAHEIVVVDNASADGSADAARRFPGVRVIETEANLGFAAGNNVGIRQSTGTNLLLLNSDTIVPPGAIDRLLAELRRDETTGIVGPRLVDGQGRAELSFGSMISPVNEMIQKILVRGHSRGWPIVTPLVERSTTRAAFPDWVSGACLLVRRADAEAVGLLDERFFMYTEDVDFCAAVRHLGKRVRFAPEVEIVHLRGRSAQSAAAGTERAYRRSQLAFYQKHHPAWTPLLRLYLRWRGADR